MTLSSNPIVGVHAITYPPGSGLLPAKLEISSSHAGALSVHVTNAWGHEKHHIDIDIPASCSLRLQEHLAPGDILMVMIIGDEFGSMDCLYLQVEQETQKLVIRETDNHQLQTQFQFELKEEKDITSLFSRLHVPWCEGDDG